MYARVVFRHPSWRPVHVISDVAPYRYHLNIFAIMFSCIHVSLPTSEFQVCWWGRPGVPCPKTAGKECGRPEDLVWSKSEQNNYASTLVFYFMRRWTYQGSTGQAATAALWEARPRLGGPRLGAESGVAERQGPAPTGAPGSERVRWSCGGLRKSVSSGGMVCLYMLMRLYVLFIFFFRVLFNTVVPDVWLMGKSLFMLFFPFFTGMVKALKRKERDTW